jgi:hypothetical protein
MATKKVRQQILPPPLFIVFVVFKSGIRVPDGKRIRIRDKHPGSATQENTTNPPSPRLVGF